MYRLAIAAIISILFWAPQAFALSPLEDQSRLTADSKTVSHTVVRIRQPQTRVDRWRGAPYARSENEVLRREALDKRLIRGGEMPVATQLSHEGDQQLRREALDKRFPIPDFGTSPASVSFSEGDEILRREALDKRMPLPNFGSSLVPGLGF